MVRGPLRRNTSPIQAYSTYMEAFSAISTAVALGAAAALKDTTAQVIKDGYSKFKNLISKKFPDVSSSIEQLEKAPASPSRRSVVEEDLKHAGAGENQDLLALAQELLKLIEKNGPGLAAVIGVSLEDIKAASLKIADVQSSGVGVKVQNAEFAGDVSIEKVRAGHPDIAGPNG